MAELDLRPLSLGEILDRTFSLYRQNFLLFVGIAALPQLLILAVSLAQLLLNKNWIRGLMQARFTPAWVASFLASLVVSVVAYVLVHGGTVSAVSDLYMGNSTSIGTAVRRMRGEVANLVGVVLLNGMAVLVGAMLLILPGIYLACRLAICIPAALLENLGPRESLERSFRLTKDNTGRSFLIYLLTLVLFYGAVLFFSIPFGIMMSLSHKDPGMLRMWTALTQVGASCAAVLVKPIFTIATTIFYYDLRVRKEAFDLQLMMGATGERGPRLPLCRRCSPEGASERVYESN